MGIYEDIKDILKYLSDEEKHFEESGKPKKHIWVKIKRVDDWLDSPFCPLTPEDEV